MWSTTTILQARDQGSLPIWEPVIYEEHLYMQLKKTHNGQTLCKFQTFCNKAILNTATSMARSWQNMCEYYMEETVLPVHMQL